MMSTTSSPKEVSKTEMTEKPAAVETGAAISMTWDCVCACGETINEQCSGMCDPRKGHRCMCEQCVGEVSKTEMTETGAAKKKRTIKARVPIEPERGTDNSSKRIRLGKQTDRMREKLAQRKEVK